MPASRKENPRLQKSKGWYDKQPSFSFAKLDNAGEWGWSSASDKDKLLILQNLVAYSGQNWQELIGNKHHEDNLNTLPNKPRKRLEQLGHINRKGAATLGDWFRFSLGDKRRLWGWLADGVFYIVWWDAEHTVRPTPPKNT